MHALQQSHELRAQGRWLLTWGKTINVHCHIQYLVHSPHVLPNAVTQVRASCQAALVTQHARQVAGEPSQTGVILLPMTRQLVTAGHAVPSTAGEDAVVVAGHMVGMSVLHDPLLCQAWCTLPLEFPQELHC
jgi:hypothetical protein